MISVFFSAFWFSFSFLFNSPSEGISVLIILSSFLLSSIEGIGWDWFFISSSFSTCFSSHLIEILFSNGLFKFIGSSIFPEFNSALSLLFSFSLFSSNGCSLIFWLEESEIKFFDSFGSFKLMFIFFFSLFLFSSVLFSDSILELSFIDNSLWLGISLLFIISFINFSFMISGLESASFNSLFSLILFSVNIFSKILFSFSTFSFNSLFFSDSFWQLNSFTFEFINLSSFFPSFSSEFSMLLILFFMLVSNESLFSSSFIFSTFSSFAFSSSLS